MHLFPLWWRAFGIWYRGLFDQLPSVYTSILLMVGNVSCSACRKQKAVDCVHLWPGDLLREWLNYIFENLVTGNCSRNTLHGSSTLIFPLTHRLTNITQIYNGILCTRSNCTFNPSRPGDTYIFLFTWQSLVKYQTCDKPLPELVFTYNQFHL